jgi:hypothetical protein
MAVAHLARISWSEARFVPKLFTLRLFLLRFRLCVRLKRAKIVLGLGIFRIDANRLLERGFRLR